MVNIAVLSVFVFIGVFIVVCVGVSSGLVVYTVIKRHAGHLLRENKLFYNESRTIVDSLKNNIKKSF